MKYLRTALKAVLFCTWMLPLNLAGGLLLSLARLFGQVNYVVRCHELGLEPFAFEVILQQDGWFARKMRRPTPNGQVLAAQTVGCFMFFYVARPDMTLVRHESHHVTQQLYFGPLHWIIYLGSFLYGLVRHRTFFEAYRNVIWEKDARKFAGEEP